MSVVKTDRPNNEAEIAITITKEDYQPKLNDELKEYRQKAHMKGFRKGKVPMSVIKKMYGKAMLADVINSLIQQKLGSFIEESKLDLLGQPIPSKDQETFDFTLDGDVEFRFLFDVGVAPDFELQGVDDTSSFEIPKVIVTDELVTKDLEALQKRQGKEVFPEDNIEEADRLRISAKEKDGDAVKNKGFETSFPVLVTNIADDTLREEVMKMKKGDTFSCDIYKLEKERTEEFVKKHLLGLEDEEMDREIGNMFEMTIAEVIRIEPAGLDQEFFDAVFGEDEVQTEEGARQKLKERIESFYKGQSEALLFKDFQEQLMEMHDIQLPDSFLKRWLLASNENLEDKELQQEYPVFAKNLLWNLIERKVQEKYEIKVEVDEVKEVFRRQLRQYFGNYPVSDDLLEGSVGRMMSDKDQFSRAYDECMSDKVFEAIRDNVTIRDRNISLEDFEELIKEAEATKVANLPVGTDEEE